MGVSYFSDALYFILITLLQHDPGITAKSCVFNQKIIYFPLFRQQEIIYRKVIYGNSLLIFPL